jgi:hypothetical protein
LREQIAQHLPKLLGLLGTVRGLFGQSKAATLAATNNKTFDFS